MRLRFGAKLGWRDVSDEGKPSTARNRRPPSGPVSSPRAYFGRASRAATRALRNGITEAEPFPPTVARPRQFVYRAGDPAMRLLPTLTLPFPPTTPLTGAIATLSGMRDGEHERLFIDLGTSLVRATPRRDDDAGTLALVLSRTQSAETYRGLLASLRYVNDAAAPTDGGRRIAVQIVDASGRTQEVVSSAFGVGAAPPEALPEEVPEIDEPEIDEPIVLGEKIRFNSDGDFTLFWWPRLLPGAADRGRRSAKPGDADADAGDAENAAGQAGSFFSAGGRVYRLFDPQAERPALPERRRAPVVANDRVPKAVAPNWSAPAAANAPEESDAVWTPERGVPQPGFERARMLRLEDIFGSDMQDAVARRLIELRIAAAG